MKIYVNRLFLRSVVDLKRAELAVLALTFAFLAFMTGSLLTSGTGQSQDGVLVVTEKNLSARTEAPVMVNINTATAPELTALSGIGDKLSGAIVDYREENGPFKAIEDIMNVPGIGAGKFANIKEHIYVE